MTLLSVIIPCHKEDALFRERLIRILKQAANTENIQLVVADSMYNPELKLVSDHLGIQYFNCSVARRSSQMNIGAKHAIHNTIFFLHLDSIPPKDFDLLILETIEQGHDSGCFRLSFDDSGWFLQFFAWFTRFRWPLARGGDQGLFITRALFDHIHGFRDELAIMEDIDICRRLLKNGKFAILKEIITTSTRKYKKYGAFRLQLIFGYIHLLYWLGFSNEYLLRVYRSGLTLKL